MEKEELINYLIEKGYDRVMEQIEEASEDVQDFVSYCLIKSLTKFEVHFRKDPYGAFSVLEDSELYKHAFAICGGLWFVIFDEEQYINKKDEIFHDIIDWAFFHKKANDSIISSIEDFGN